MPLYVDGTKIKKIVYRGTNIKKLYCNGTPVFNLDHTVTYQIKNQSWTATVEEGDNAATISSSNNTAFEKMDGGDSFLGWTTTDGSKTPESTIICDRDNMRLYGIWKHAHIGSSNVKGGCYQGEATTYTPIRFIKSDTQTSDSCGCCHQKHYWHCDICGSNFSTQTNNSAVCTEGHNLNDDTSAACSHFGNSGVTVYEVSCGKSEGTFCG